MCWFFFVIKLLTLKILLDGLTGLTTASRYDYGYHPSAEEFDNLLRETRRTWTNSFLKAERNRLLMQPAQRRHDTIENRAKTEIRYFVPKFQYKNERKNIQHLMKNSLPHKQHHDLEMDSTQNHPVPLQNIGSSLEFNYFSDELTEPSSNPSLEIPHMPVGHPSITTTSSALPEKNSKPLAKPDILNANRYSINNLYRNNSQGHFPIYFTNPVTGKIYAITEVGKATENVATTNGTIPIFITKDQYERDIHQLRNDYEEKCRDSRLNTTSRPHIIQIQNESSHELSITSSNFVSSTIAPSPTPIRRPSPVKVKAELIHTNKDPTTPRPLRAKKKRTKPKRKIKKQKPPGHRRLTTTVRPILANQPQGPVIIMGTRTSSRKPTVNYDKLPAQLEKPNLFNIFSSANVPQTSKLSAATINLNHTLNKRSLGEVVEGYLKSSENMFKDNLHEYRHNFNEKFKHKIIKNLLKQSTDLKVKNNLNKLNLFQHKKITPSKLNKNFIKTNDFLKTPKSSFTKKPLKNISDFNKIQNFKSDVFKTKENHTNYMKLNVTNENNKILRDLLSNPLKSFQNLLSNNSHFEKSFKTISTSLKTQHRINKRSVLNLTTNNYTSPKFIKKPNNTLYNTKTNETQNGAQVALKVKEQQKSVKATGLHNKTPTQGYGNRKSINRTKQHLVKTKFKRKPSSKHKKRLKKRKKLTKLKISGNLQQNTTLNRTNISSGLTTTPRTIKKGQKKKKNKKVETKSERQQDTEYYFFGIGGNYDDDGEDEEEDEDDEEDDKNNADEYEYEDEEDEEDNEEEDQEEEQEEEEEDYNNRDEILAYDDDDMEPQSYTSEVSLSIEDLSEKPTQETSSSPEDDAEIGVVEIKRVDFKTPLLDYDTANKLLYTKSNNIKKRIRRRPPQLKIDEDDYDEEEDTNSISSNIGGLLRMILYPLQAVVSSVMDSIGGKDADEQDEYEPAFNPYTQYTSYHNTLKQHSSAEYDDDYDSTESSDSSLSSWLSSWFGLSRRNKKIGSTTITPVLVKPTKSSNGWLPSWMGFGTNDRVTTETASNEDYDDYDKWFASWFGEIKPKVKKRTTTTTTTTTQIPHVPILTIVDPMKNPQNWIGILAHHIINHNSTSTENPLKDIWNKVTTTTTENPEIPRKISYEKYQIWRLKPQDDSQVKALEEYKKSEDGIKLQWLKGPSLRGLTDVLVPPKMLVDFQASLTFELIDHEVLIFDVGKAIAYEKTKEDYFFTTTQKPKKHHNRNPSIPKSGMTWRKYYEYDDIIKYLETMRMRFPHLVELIHIGRSYEGRPLIVMKIESKEAAAVNSAHYPAHQRNKLRHKKRIGLANAVFIEAGTHGMEWIGPATATWIINELLRIMKKNVTDDQSFIHNTTWYVMPVLNPDGYVYSHEYDRFWKKSRSRHVSRPSGILNSAMTWLQKKRAKEKVCFGVDLDRNWHYQWGRRGSSKTPCNEFYAGPTPFSEPETKALSEFLMDYRTQIKLFVSMQAYGQIISYPYKANTTYDSERLDDLLDVAMVGTDGLRKKGSKSRYKIDSSNDLVENRSGCSDAFAAYEVGIPFSYTLQLADNGVHGYLLPSASIESTAKDSFEIITGMLDYI